MNLRQRMVAAALVPVSLVAAVLTAFFVWQHLDDLDRGLMQRGDGLARQAAEMSEFYLFSGNRERLRPIIQGLLRTDGDVRAVSVLDDQSQLVIQAGVADPVSWPPPGNELARTRVRDGIVIRLPVIPKSLAVDDAYSGAEFAVASRPREVIGYAVVEMSGKALEDDRRELIHTALTTAAVGLLLGGLLALRIARTVTEPALEATEVVTRIGHGDLAARVDAEAAGALGSLAQGINAMAEQVTLTQDELAHKVQSATAELVRQRDAAEQATAAKSRFLAAASHDLRQPLHAMGLFVSRLGSLSLRGEERRLVDHVEQSVATLQDMLDTLLDLSRLDAGGFCVDLQDFELTPLLQQACREMAPLAQQRRIGLRLRCRPLVVHGDPRLVQRVVLNLLSNALCHTEKGDVLVTCRQVNGRARIQVWDTGPGIPLDMQRSIFDEYVQLGNPERERSKGLGLGLTICQRIAHLLDTTIGLRSVPGRGSVFWIDLPPATVVPAVEAHGEAAAWSPFSGTVLVVDDDAQCRDGTAEAIAGWGGDVRTARDAAEALALIADSSVDYRVAICDIRLPGSEDGLILGERLRQERPGLGVVLISADSAPLVQARARRAGFPLLRKPVSAARLRATLLSLLDPPSA
jgi:two-component system, sensor histidine kinase